MSRRERPVAYLIFELFAIPVIPCQSFTDYTITSKRVRWASYTAVSARVRSPWFRVAGLAYLISVVLAALTGVSITLVYLCLQAVAFLSISVDNQENQAQAAAR